MGHLIHALSHLILHAFARHRYAILFSLVLVEEAGVPIPVPGDTLVMIAGGQEHKTLLYDVVVIALASLAVFLGSSVLYFVSRRGGRTLLTRYGKVIRLHPRRLERVERWFEQRGQLAIILGRLIPGLRIPTTIMAGLSNISYRVYAPTAALAAVIWSVFYFFVGALIQREWGLVTGIVAGLLDEVSDYIVVVWIVLVLLSVSFGAWHVSLRVRRQRRARSERLGRLRHPLRDPVNGADGMGH